MKYLFYAFVLMFVFNVQADVPPRNIINLKLSKNDNYSDSELRESCLAIATEGVCVTN
ncbi:MAG: hypothetical protein VX341_06185 [Bdellovibrionota bacterium]|nr:hypothetical protein [Bdellovibrionota bacterium]